MAFPRSFFKYTTTLTLTGTDEIANFGFHATTFSGEPTATTWEAVTETFTEVTNHITTFVTGANNEVPNKWAVQSIKAAWIGTDGKYVPDVAPIERIYETTLPGASTQRYAPQLAAVVTLVSGKYKDPGKYNRFYLPTTGTTEAGGVMEAFRPEYLATGAADMIEAINAEFAAVDTNVNVVVMSAKGVGSALKVQNVRVGNVIDTQRRRRNKLIENYFTAEVS